jgi:ketosteroid isomerase-like protein
MTTLTYPTTEEIANDLVTKCRNLQFAEAKQAHYSSEIVSIEACAMPGSPKEICGLEAVVKKGEEWKKNTEVHSLSVTDPLVGGNCFAVQFTMDMTCKQTNQRFTMQELALYQVENGKIVREEFFYDAE